MHKIGLSFRSTLSPEDVRTKYINPLRAALRHEKAGIYSNHLRQVDPHAVDTFEHLLVFEVNDFEKAVRLLRVELTAIGPPAGAQFHNLDPSQPSY
jgi:hypothetical protein